MVFQIVDDMLDITATDEQLGKPAGHDMVEGVYTLPVLRTLQAGGVAAVELLALLGKPLGAVEREKALSIVRSNGGVAAAMQVAREWASRAEAACELLPPSVATDVLFATPSALLATLCSRRRRQVPDEQFQGALVRAIRVTAARQRERGHRQ